MSNLGLFVNRPSYIGDEIKTYKNERIGYMFILISERKVECQLCNYPER